MRVLTIDIKAQFSSLANQLSPENLSCDGELSQGQVRQKAAGLKKQWEALEKQCGQKVREDDTWGWSDELSKYRETMLQAELATYEQHPLMLTSPGVWNRKGAKYAFDMVGNYTLYYIHKRRERKTVLMGKNYTDPADPFFTLYCDFSRTLYREETLGEFSTLQECVDEGEAFLKQDVTFANFKLLTKFSDESIARELAKLG